MLPAEDEKHSIYLVYKAEFKDDKIKLCEEHEEYRWLTKSELQFLKLGFNAEPIIGMIQ